MSSPNLHIEDYLNYYYSFDKEPGYAILLKGKWGTGKTWFINKTLNSLKVNGGRHLYVSLYGITTFDEIEDEFFKQLHPLLSSKSMALTGKIAKGLLKATLKIDLDGDGKHDGSVSIKPPNVDLPEYLTNTSGFVIIFDDLERSSINLESLLGYINHYVEHQGYKVIIIANEDEILEQQKTNHTLQLSYRRIKEKLIGKTFEIEPDLKGALFSFISEVKNEKINCFYNLNLDIISELYTKSSYKNLRHLKQALWDFERFAMFISSEAMDKEGLLTHLLKIFLIFSFEIKSGSILPKDIYKFNMGYISSSLKDKEHTENKEEYFYQGLKTKYNNINLRDLLIEESIWVSFFDRGSCSSEEIQESIEKSEYYRTKNTPAWVKLWHLLSLNDDEFNNSLASVESDFHENNFTEVGVIKHITGIFLLLSEINLITKTKAEILESSYLYINHLKDAGLLVNPIAERPIFRENDSWGGLGFHEKDSKEFKLLVSHIEEKSAQATIENHPEAGIKLLELIDTDPHLFYRRITHCNSTDNFYYETPILKHIDPIAFVHKFLSVKPDSQRTVCYAISERYSITSINHSLITELPWLESVTAQLLETRLLREGKISGYQLQSYINDYFKTALETLKQCEIEKQRS